MTPTCATHCKHGTMKCPTPYTCGIYNLEDTKPLHVDASDRKQQERTLRLRLLADAAKVAFYVGLAFVTVVCISIASLK